MTVSDENGTGTRSDSSSKENNHQELRESPIMTLTPSNNERSERTVETNSTLGEHMNCGGKLGVSSKNGVNSDLKAAQKRKGSYGLEEFQGRDLTTEAVSFNSIGPKERKLKDDANALVEADRRSLSLSSVDAPGLKPLENQLQKLQMMLGAGSRPEAREATPLKNDSSAVKVDQKKLKSCLKDPHVKKTKKPKKSVRFDKEIVYSFERMQGFESVPSQGGASLGMKYQHHDVQEFSLEQTDGARRRTSSGDATYRRALFPISLPHRRNLLRECGVLQIDPADGMECEMIRASREHIGCDCRAFCDPANCFCIINKIQCQADGSPQSCWCTVNGCKNPNGRGEFDAVAVRTHVIRTLNRANRELGLRPGNGKYTNGTGALEESRVACKP